MDLQAGAQVDRYTLVALLGEGGQGQVWSALDPLAPGRRFAIKLLWLDLADPTEAERARREGRHLAGLSHPALPGCHAIFEDVRRKLLGVVLDLLEGTPLHQAASGRRLDEGQIRRVVARVAEGLAYLHREGIVHRDIKPENIILLDRFWSHPEDPTCIKVIDLGISVRRGNPRPLTVVGHLIGTPPYMPPEQIDPSFWRAPDDTPAADVFALGVTAWWLLTQAHPSGVDMGEPLPPFARAYRAVAEQRRPWPPECPPSWAPFFAQSLALAHRDRAPSAGHLLPLLGEAAPAGLAPQPAALTGDATPLQAPTPAASALASSALHAGPAAPAALATGPAASMPAGLASSPTGAATPIALSRAAPVAVTQDDLRPMPAPAALARVLHDGAITAVTDEHASPGEAEVVQAERAREPSSRRRALLLGALLGALATLLATSLWWRFWRPRRRAAQRREHGAAP